MEQEEFYLKLCYKNKTQRFKISEPNLPLKRQMEKLRTEVKDPSTGKPFFDMPLVDKDGAPVEYFFGKIDENGEAIVLQPKIGKKECCLRDYNIKNGDTLEIIMDPIAG